MLMSGADVGQPGEGTYNGIPVEEWPRVVLSPSFAPGLAQIKVRGSVCIVSGLLMIAQAVQCMEGTPDKEYKRSWPS